VQIPNIPIRCESAVLLQRMAVDGVVDECSVCGRIHRTLLQTAVKLDFVKKLVSSESGTTSTEGSVSDSLLLSIYSTIL